MPEDITFVFNNLAVGGGIFTVENMKFIKKNYGITHVLDAQGEFDDTPLGREAGVEVCWAPLVDDYRSFDERQLKKAADFIFNSIYSDPSAKLLCHCAAGVHRGPAYGLLAAMLSGMKAKEAIKEIESRRLIASFPDTYVKCISDFTKGYLVKKYGRSG